MENLDLIYIIVRNIFPAILSEFITFFFSNVEKQNTRDEII